jgi:hypothetical protein
MTNGKSLVFLTIAKRTSGGKRGPDTTMPHEVNCMAKWGRTGKLRILIIVGSGA